jgi:hypothetical protein
MRFDATNRCQHSERCIIVVRFVLISTACTICLSVKSYGNDPAESSDVDSLIMPILGIIPIPLVSMDLVPKSLESGRSIYESVDATSTTESSQK